MREESYVNIIGAGLAGLSAALTFARAGKTCNLISSMPSERAQSVLAEGGINAALDTMGENDSVAEHFADTMRGGCFMESESAVRQLTDNAPEVVRELVRLGVPFQSEKGRLILRNFGGQKKKRTAYAKSSTGKMLMSALIDEVRKYESQGLVKRYDHHELTDMKVSEGKLEYIEILDTYTKKIYTLSGCTILCTGGLNGFFEGATTGTTQNSGNAAALAFYYGAQMANLEFIQYHPTTVKISDKCMLISEAARGEGGRLFTIEGGRKRYFMEEKYPQSGNLMPRDVISREIAMMKREDPERKFYLDLSGIDKDTWKNKLSDLKKEVASYLRIDPEKEPVPIEPGIHYFMGGIRVDDEHKSSIQGLYAAGEAACKYHGANRLGGNSMLGAILGGRIAAESAMHSLSLVEIRETENMQTGESSAAVRKDLSEILLSALGVLREEESLQKAQKELEALHRKATQPMDQIRICLAEAMLTSALVRKESRGAHVRLDYPKTLMEYQKQTVVKRENGKITIRFMDADERGW